MFSQLEHWVGLIVVIALIAYALTGGADFGGGVWDLFARGPSAKAQRNVIKDAIAPIWEANHVWLILVIVLMFVCFPKAFALLSTALHIPLTIMLFGIVLRGSAFVFRSYDSQNDATQRKWSLIFSIASLMTPIMLGISLGAVVSGQIRPGLYEPSATMSFTKAYISPWLTTFSVFLGFYIVLLFSFLAAVYLTLESKNEEIQEVFRKRALVTGVLVGVLAWVCVFLARSGAPVLYKGLTQSSWSIPFQLIVGLVAGATLFLLWKRKYGWARFSAMAQLTLIVGGWGLSQFPYLIVPDYTVMNAAAPHTVLKPVIWVLVLGTPILLPSFWYLYNIFKGQQEEAHIDSSKTM